MVTSPHDLASQAGLEVLQAGGNAIEAAIAIGATLCVTYPHFSGLGGDAFMIISDRKGNGLTLSGIGQAAAKPPNYSGTIPVRGPGSALTAAAPSTRGIKLSSSAKDPGAVGSLGRVCSNARSSTRQTASR